MSSLFDQRPILLVLAGPNGAGKSTFYKAHLEASGLPFINADVLAKELHLGAYQAAETAKLARENLVAERKSFVFETVFSDPEGEKLAFLKKAEDSGYTVVLFFVGIEDAESSEARVAMRVLQGGHDVPTEKLRSRYERSMNNLRSALKQLRHVRVYDNSDLADAYRLVVELSEGKIALHAPLPEWLLPLLPKTFPVP